MKSTTIFATIFALLSCSQILEASQADEVVITVVEQNAGPTPFIKQLSLVATETNSIKSIQFTITPKPSFYARPLSGTYAASYLVSRGNLNPATGEIFLPVYGLYADYVNTVDLTYDFEDGSSKTATVTITTEPFSDPCLWGQPMVLQPRTSSTALSYDYMLVKGSCSDFSPAIIDSDGALRWVGSAGLASLSATFFDNAIYIGGIAADKGLYRIDLDGTVTFLATYNELGITFIHHNFDRGKVGVIMDVNTAEWTECTNIEIDASGKVVKTWKLGEIISAAMVAGGDDPSQFVAPSPGDWFHNNAAIYNRADDSIIVSSRENFLICLDYETGAIKWILGDPNKKWHQFPSLAKYALTLAPGTVPPIGQHAVSISYDQDILVFDNGENSRFQFPQGDRRLYASPRKYRIDLAQKTATEVWNYEQDQKIFDPFCSSVYEDAPLNYLINYSMVNGAGLPTTYAQLLGLDAEGNVVFYYQYSADRCEIAFNAMPLHLENTAFPTVGPQALNLSSRGVVSRDENALIGGFIVTGTQPKKVALRAIGPSLDISGSSGVVADPNLTLFGPGGLLIATNDNWQTDSSAEELRVDGLAPPDPLEAAMVRTLSPGLYTAVTDSGSSASGVGLVELYDLSPGLSSQLANISARGSVGDGDGVLISGFIIGDVANATVVVRALGPSLAQFQIARPLSDPSLSVFDRNGTQIGFNDNWGADNYASDIQQQGLAPTDPLEAATVLQLPAGEYSVVVAGAEGETGVGLTEVYDLP